MNTLNKDAEKNETVRYYELKADEFARDTAHASVAELLDEFVALLPEGALILDWGCGTGRDSRELLDRGFAVVSIDASDAMCAKAKELFGVDARCESFSDLNFDNAFDGIWACASLVHIGKEDLPGILGKAEKALKPRGVLYASFKLGAFEGMRSGRWFTDLEEESLLALLPEGFEVIRIWVTDDVRPSRSGERWLNSLLRKRS